MYDSLASFYGFIDLERSFYLENECQSCHNVISLKPGLPILFDWMKKTDFNLERLYSVEEAKPQSSVTFILLVLGLLHSICCDNTLYHYLNSRNFIGISSQTQKYSSIGRMAMSQNWSSYLHDKTAIRSGAVITY